MNRILYRLLSRHINAGQLAGFVLANLCGMTIVLAAVQFATDIIPMFTGNDSFLKPGQMVMAKHVSTVRTLTGKAPTFSAEEIADVSQQPFVKEAGTFTPSLFSVVATLGSRKLGVEFSTEMFFEAVPDDFIDVDLSRWQWHEGDDEVPIILPRNYLDLYNFGFASSQGLPALSESLVSMIKIRFYLRGSAGSKELSGRVVAFSKKLNTILVPQTFMDEMNATLSPDRQPEPSRLILTVSNPADERIAPAYHYQHCPCGRPYHQCLGFLRPTAEHLPVASEEYGEDRHPAAHRLFASGCGTPLPSAHHQPQHAGAGIVGSYCHHAERILSAIVWPVVPQLQCRQPLPCPSDRPGRKVLHVWHLHEH